MLQYKFTSIRHYSYKFVIRTRLIALLVLTLVSCGKKKQIITSTYDESNGMISSRYEKFIERDSAFETTTDGPSGKLMKIGRAKDLAELNAGTYTEEGFFYSFRQNAIFQKIHPEKTGRQM